MSILSRENFLTHLYIVQPVDKTVRRWANIKIQIDVIMTVSVCIILLKTLKDHCT